MSPVSEFCLSRGIDGYIKSAFSAYVKSVCADRYLLHSDADTLVLLIGKLTQAQVDDLWVEFVNDLKKYLTS